jgi:hypothetical protein
VSLSLKGSVLFLRKDSANFILGIVGFWSFCSAFSTCWPVLHLLFCKEIDVWIDEVVDCEIVDWCHLFSTFDGNRFIFDIPAFFELFFD